MKSTLIILINALSFVLFLGCTDKRTKEEIFWDWFTEHQQEYFIDSVNQELYNPLTAQLEKVDPGLTFEFSPVHKNGIKELIISAAGIKETFPAVIKLVDKAPEFEKWKINAFRQRVPDNYSEIHIGSVKLSYDDIYFTYEIEADKINIALFVKDYVNNADYGNAVFLSLDHLLGEYDVETKIGGIEVLTLPEEGTDTLQHFVKLREIVDSNKK